jgi:hypothetical protein
MIKKVITERQKLPLIHLIDELMKYCTAEIQPFQYNATDYRAKKLITRTKEMLRNGCLAVHPSPDDGETVVRVELYRLQRNFDDDAPLDCTVSVPKEIRKAEKYEMQDIGEEGWLVDFQENLCDCKLAFRDGNCVHIIAGKVASQVSFPGYKAPEAILINQYRVKAIRRNANQVNNNRGRSRGRGRGSLRGRGRPTSVTAALERD